MPEAVVKLEGMTCAACAGRIERGLNKLPETEATVNFAMEEATVRWTDNSDTEFLQNTIIDKIRKLGYDASPKTALQEHQDSGKGLLFLKIQTILAALLSAPLLYTMGGHFGQSLWPVPELFNHGFFQAAISFPVQFILGFRFYRGAWTSLRHGSANMDVLVALGTSVAWFYSLFLYMEHAVSAVTMGVLGDSARHPHYYFESSAVLITFILTGKYLELRARNHTRDALKKLAALQAGEAVVVARNGKRLQEETRIPLEHVQPGDVVRVLPGERIPTDGIVVHGQSSVNESLISGESMPVERSLGDRVTGSTINQYGSLEVRTTHTGSESVLARIIRTVEQAQSGQAPVQKLADRISAWFVPFVLIVSLATFCSWFYLLDSDLAAAITNAVAVLVIACPCALGLATPVSILVGSGRAAQFGILFKDAEAIQKASEVNCVVFDKTGTVTSGRPQVVNDIWLLSGSSQLPEAWQGWSASQMRELMEEAALKTELASEHPLAAALVKHLHPNAPHRGKDKGKDHGKDITIERGRVSLMTSRIIPGAGVEGDLQLQRKNPLPFRVFLSSPDALASRSVPIPKKGAAFLQEQAELGLTTVCYTVELENGPVLCAMYALEDRLRSDSGPALAAMQEAGWKLHLLSGDRQQVTERIASRLGIEHCAGEADPESKMQYVDSLSDQVVAMVGDGINDAPALAKAHLGVALSGGSDIAMEAADAALTGGSVGQIFNLFLLSRATMSNIRQNLFWALGYNVLAIPLAALGYLAPWVAGGAMALSSVSVVLNSLRLGRWKARSFEQGSLSG
jgi:Cu+-exporting ATPase